MKEYILENGIKLIYIKGTSELTSISIGLEAGASQDGKLLGLAHATEHMIYKGTKMRSEAMINEEFSKLFGFYNAMTNYPYVIYYGTLLGEDFYKGTQLFSDLLINATFPKEGFKEEMDVIIEELNEWDEELDQYCEDRLLYNSYESNRLKYPIIGTRESLNNITLKDIRNFYNKFYSPKNTSIAVVTALEFNDVKDIIKECFESWVGEEVNTALESLEEPKSGIFKEERDNNSCKVQMNFSIANLNELEIKAFRIFNEYFAEGINSLLFDRLRTKNGLVYDVLSRISNEKYIRFYKITFTTSKDKIEKSLSIVKEAINDIKILSDKEIQELIKRIRIKKLFKEEQSIQLAKEVATYSAMFKDYKVYDNMLEGMENIKGDFIFQVAKKVLEKSSIEIIS
ncbi:MULTISPECIES: pitrilysin family protein [Clostridium]|uniref:Insulinase family protein n=1 Tax=Clostridium cibarium TaxID=2762247 RepID=A0ABR8PVG7_9CLOT|nr:MULTISPECIES: pitrilysin family protein [Clostridium]MBD7912127.1 insulinase family protein [Clostridium cibarium]